MTPDKQEPDRRTVLTTLGGLTLAGVPVIARAQAGRQPDGARDRTRDWAWLAGDWDVSHRRLRRRLAGDVNWDEFGGRSAVWLTMGGLGTIDDNILDLPGGIYRATGVRAFDPVSGRWLIWWLDGRNPTRIDPPVHGTFDGDEGLFLGEDVFEGRPIRVRFRWHEIHGSRPHWDQAFSPDDGADDGTVPPPDPRTSPPSSKEFIHEDRRRGRAEGGRRLRRAERRLWQ